MATSGLYTVIAGGEEPQGLALRLVEESSYIVCADSGADFCFKNKLTPEIIIGDLDSLSAPAADYFAARGVKFSVHPAAKDYTDTDLAVAWCMAKAAEDVALVGALGGRIDHSLANIMLLVKYPGLVIADENSLLRLCRGHLRLHGAIGDLMTLIPLSPVVKNISLKGFLYPLKGRDLLMRNNIGVSNVFTEEEAEVSIELGELLVICTRKKEKENDRY